MAELPDWQPLDDVRPPASRGEAGRFVAFVASERAVANGWAADAALDLARRWSRAGERVVLVDGGLNYPSLHAAAGLPNREGLSDAALHGASVELVSRPVDGGAFFVVTAGSPVADPHTVVRSPRWYRISAGFAEAGVTLALYVRDGDPGTAAFMGSVSDIVVLAEAGDRPPECVRDIEPLVRTVAGPGAGGVARMPTVAEPITGVEPTAGQATEVESVIDRATEGEPAGAVGTVAGAGVAAAAGVVAVAAAARTADDGEASDEASPSGARTAATPVAAPAGGMGRMALVVVVAMLIAAALGWFLMSSLG